MEQELKTVTEQLERAKVLLDNCVRAIESEDRTAMEQSAGAGREYLSKYPAQ